MIAITARPTRPAAQFSRRLRHPVDGEAAPERAITARSASVEFRRLYQEASPSPRRYLGNLVGLLERRLETGSIARSSCRRFRRPRQFVNHGRIKVNGKRVNIGSYLLKDGDVVEVREKSRDLHWSWPAPSSNERDVPDYIRSGSQEDDPRWSKFGAGFARGPVPMTCDIA